MCSDINFKGQYIVRGTKEEISGFKRYYRETYGTFFPVQTITISHKDDSYTHIVATKDDAYNLSKVKENKSFIETFRSSKGNIFARLANAFNQTGLGDSDTRIFNAKDILSNVGGFDFFNGILTTKTNKCLDETEERYKDFNIIERKFPDGTIDTYDVRYRYLKSRTYADGKKNEFYGNGSLKKELSPDGSYVKYSKDGEIELICDKDGNITKNPPKAKVTKNEDKDGDYKKYYSDGTLREEYIKSEGVTRTYTPKGRISSEVYDNGSYTKYNSLPQAKQKIKEQLIKKDGKEILYKNGRLIEEKDDKTIKTYNYVDDKATIPVFACIHKIGSDRFDNEYEYYNENGEVIPDVIFTFEEDENSNITFIFPDGKEVTHLFYGPIAYHIVEDEEGNKLYYSYSRRNCLCKKVNKDGSGESYNIDGSISKTDDGKGNITCYSRDGSVCSRKYADGRSFYYWDDGSISEEKYPDGSIKKYNKDSDLTYERYSDGTSVFYDNGKLRNRTDSNGKVIESYYSSGKVEIKTDENGILRRYDESGKIDYIILPDNTKRNYNKAGHIIKEILPDGTKKEFDRYGKILKQTNPDGSVSMWNYNNSGYLVSANMADGTVKKYVKGIIKSETLPDGTVRYYKNEKVKFEKHPDGKVYKYFKNGELKIDITSHNDISDLFSDKAFFGAYSSFSSTVAWTLSLKTKDIMSEKAKGDGYLISILGKIDQNKAYDKAMTHGDDTSNLELSPISKKEEIKYKSYLKNSWLESGTEEFSIGKTIAHQIFLDVLENGINVIEDEDIKETVKIWADENPEYFEVLFG